ncbi:MAG: hypothetical protein NVSMB21_23240 [Vulcanimicrobiaceae bacterium]
MLRFPLKMTSRIAGYVARKKLARAERFRIARPLRGTLGTRRAAQIDDQARDLPRGRTRRADAGPDRRRADVSGA